MQKPEYPDEALIASIQHEAEKLGYLVAQVEKMFDHHVRYDRHQETVRHSLQGTKDLEAYLAGEINAEELAERSAVLLQSTSDNYDRIKGNYQHNMNTLNQMVLDHIAKGKAQAHDLDNTLSEILKEGEANE
jgi:nicotinamide mononucleotide adenylyltransferase